MSDRPLSDKDLEDIEDALEMMSKTNSVSFAFQNVLNMDVMAFIANTKKLIKYYDREGARTSR
jgi:hypothetical protein